MREIEKRDFRVLPRTGAHDPKPRRRRRKPLAVATSVRGHPGVK